MATIPKFPEDFSKRSHPVVKRAAQYLYPPLDPSVRFINKETTTISIVGGGTGLYGDGVTTFELMDNREGKDDVLGYQTIEEINQYLQDNPIEG
jgi:hypothetical protein